MHIGLGCLQNESLQVMFCMIMFCVDGNESDYLFIHSYCQRRTRATVRVVGDAVLQSKGQTKHRINKKLAEDRRANFPQ